MKKQFLMILAAGSLAFTACREDAGTSTETNENDSETPDHAAGDTDSTSASNFNHEQESRERANRISSKLSQDLNLDTATQARIRTVMYNRARQMEELEMRFSSKNLSGGMASDSDNGSMMSEDMTTEDGMMRDSGIAVQGNVQVTGFPEDYPTEYYSNLESINSNVDLELKGFLTPTQFKTYQTNRDKYLELNSKLNTQGDSKLKIDGEEAKYKTGDTKVKVEGDESKIKTETEKIKREDGEVKYKSGDTKIKIEN